MKIRKHILLCIISVILLFSCVQIHLTADNSNIADKSLNTSLRDPCKDQIFSERTFLNLVISIHASENDLWNNEDGRWRYFLYDLDRIGSFQELAALNFQQATLSTEYHNILPYLLQNPDYRDTFVQIIEQMEKDAFNDSTIEQVIREENEKMLPEVTYNYHSEAFDTYVRNFATSDAPEDDEYLSLEDRELMILDFKSHLLDTPQIINEGVKTLYNTK